MLFGNKIVAIMAALSSVALAIVGSSLNITKQYKLKHPPARAGARTDRGSARKA